MSGKIYFHKHHILPKHAGGTDDPSNIIKVNVALHAFLHKILHEEYGRWQDKIAYECLSGHISREEAIRQAQSLGQKGRPRTQKQIDTLVERNRKRCGPNHHFFGKKRPPETIQKMSNSHLGQIPWNKGRKADPESIEKSRQGNLNRSKYQCPVCHKMISGKGNLKQHIDSHDKAHVNSGKMVRESKNLYDVQLPDGSVETISNIAEFARQHNLVLHRLRRTLHSKTCWCDGYKVFPKEI